MENLLNNKLTRRIIGGVIGIPLTMISIVLGFHGLILLYAGVKDLELYPLSLGIATITGFIGIIGAWKRISASSEEMSEKEKSIIRAMLFCGFLSSAGLSVWAFTSNEPEVGVTLLLLTLGSIGFIFATPKKL